MTSTGRRAAIGLIATMLAGTAACAAYPQYPIARGEPSGDGGLHMTEHPQYPIGDGANAPRRDYDRDPDQSRRAAPLAPQRSDDDDMPRAVPSAPVSSSPIPPQAQADEPRAYGYQTAAYTADGQPHLIFGVAEVPAAFDQVAYRHHHAAPADDADTAKPLTKREKAKAEREKVAAAKEEAKTESRSDRRHHGKAAETADAASANDVASAPGAMPLQVTLKPGERLASVAKRLGISKQALMEVNGISADDKVKAGRVLKTPYRYAYEVKKGDTLYAIGHRFHQDSDDLAKMNTIKRAKGLQPGETVELPVNAADLGSRDHAHGEGLKLVGAPDGVIDAILRKERLAEERANAKQARLDRRHGRHSTELAQAEHEPSAVSSRGSRHHRYSSPPTDLTSSNLPSAVAQTAPEPYRPRPAYVAPTPVATETPTPTPYAPTPQTAARPTYGAASATRPPASGASETAAETRTPTPNPLAAGTIARQTVSSSETGLTTPAKPTTTYGAATPYRAPTTTYSSGTPYRAPTTTYGAAAPYRAPTTTYGAAAPRPAGSAYAAAPSATSGYPASTYGAASASAPTRVASLNTPTYSSSYGAPSLGRPRPTLSTSSGGASNSEVAAAGHGRFVWPLRGAILEPFGDRGPGQRNDGLDIVAQPGESVKAAASGEVVYAGSSIPGFGNLILVKHVGGWVTAYAHLDRIEVRMRDAVTQGQEIGQAGQTGAVSRPQLHFEIRYAPQADEKARPVDPTLVLPGEG